MAPLDLRIAPELAISPTAGSNLATFPFRPWGETHELDGQSAVSSFKNSRKQERRRASRVRGRSIGGNRSQGAARLRGDSYDPAPASHKRSASQTPTQIFSGTRLERMALSRKLIAMALWMAFAVAAPATAALADDARGEALFELCAQCHGSAGEGNQAALAPSIAGLDAWYVVAQLDKFRSGVRGTHPDDTGGLRMHPMSLALKSDADVQLVATYVASLPITDPETSLHAGDATRGEQLYTTCAACHGATGAGNEALKAPRLAGTSDWYLVSALEKYKAGIRGGNPKNSNAVMMRGMAAQLANDQAIQDVVAYIMTLDSH